MTDQKTTRQIIENALNRGSLSSLFIDLQKAFQCEETHAAYENASRLSGILPAYRVNNEFAVWPKETAELKQRSISTRANHLHLAGNDDFTPGCTPKPYDTVHVKPGFSVLSNTGYSDRINNSYAPTVIVAGVLASACVKYTLRDIMNQNARAQVVLAHDAINLETQTPEDYVLNVAASTKDKDRALSRIRTASVSEIETILSAIYY